MKKMLSLFMMALIPSFAFALAGFGIQVGSDLSKLGSYSYSEGSGLTEVTINTYEMESNPGRFGGYAFVDLFGFALEAEGEIAWRRNTNLILVNQYLPEMEKKFHLYGEEDPIHLHLKKTLWIFPFLFLQKLQLMLEGVLEAMLQLQKGKC